MTELVFRLAKREDQALISIFPILKYSALKTNLVFRLTSRD